jgi:CHASE2 domain-containing sensor protein
MNCTRSLKEETKHCLIHLLQSIYRQLRGHGYAHWLIAGALIFFGTLLGHWIGSHNVWIDLRYQTYQFFQERLQPRAPYPKRTVVVSIGDDEFWYGPLAHRTPLKRDYLANLLLKLDAANPEVIALDVDLSLPAPDLQAEEHRTYAAESARLRDAVERVCKNRTVVLARTVRHAGLEGTRAEYEAVPALFDEHNFACDGVKTGYISLPYDIRRVALDLRLKDGGRLDSFASAIARAVDARSLSEIQQRRMDALPYGSFIKPEDFTRLSAATVLATPPAELMKALAFKIVIIGGGWRQLRHNFGPLEDGHASPVGEVHGVFIHANYVEALLDSRTYRPIRERSATALEVTASAFLALVFSLHLRLIYKLVVGLFLCVVVIGLSYVSWQNLGLFFDFFIPVSLLFGHVLVEKMLQGGHERAGAGEQQGGRETEIMS